MSLSASTRFAGVIGAPVRHSLSPVIHNAWIAAAGLDGAYRAFEPAADSFDVAVGGPNAAGCVGLNVTLPFKERALALADAASERARAAGAANLLVFEAGGIRADNTDGLGLLAALAGAGFSPAGAEVVVLGAGGAARGAVLALLGAGARRVVVANRSLDRAQALARADPRVQPIAWAEAAAALAQADAVINATSLGMEGQPPLELDLSAARPAMVAMDMVYRPLRTGLLAQARARGHPVADGLSMLIAQAEPSFEALFGRPVPAGAEVRGLCEARLTP